MFTTLKLSLGQIAIFGAIAVIFVLLVLLGFKSAKLKKVLTDLFIKSSELETIKLQNKVDNLKSKARETDAKRKESAKRYRDHLKSTDT